MKTKNTVFSVPDMGNRNSLLTENLDGSSTCLYRVTDTVGNTHSASFTGTDIIAAWASNAAYLNVVKAAFPAIVTGADAAAAISFVRTLLKAYGDAAAGFE